MTDSGDKAKRVLGVFSIMIGGSLILDAQAWWFGGALAVLGGAFMVRGLIEARRGPVPAEHSAGGAPPAGGDLS